MFTTQLFNPSCSGGKFPLPESYPNDTSGLRPEWDWESEAAVAVPDGRRVGYACPGHKRADVGDHVWTAVR